MSTSSKLMNDPWEDMRQYLVAGEKHYEGVWGFDPYVTRLLTDADALLAVVRAVTASKTEDDGFEFDELGWPLIDEAMAALPEHLRE